MLYACLQSLKALRKPARPKALETWGEWATKMIKKILANSKIWMHFLARPKASRALGPWGGLHSPKALWRPPQPNCIKASQGLEAARLQGCGRGLCTRKAWQNFKYVLFFLRHPCRFYLIICSTIENKKLD